MKRIPMFVALTTVLFASVVMAQTYNMPRQVVASGATDATNSTYRLRGTVGQGIIGLTAGSQNRVEQGFWHRMGPNGVEISKNEMPGDFNLYQNYPNPFNPTTDIRFTLPSRQHVVLRVFSSTGNLVKVLVDDNMSAGDYTVKFTANELPTGTYLYSLEAAGHVMTKRMILIK